MRIANGLLAVAVAFGGCQSTPEDTAPPPVPAGCQPLLGGADCFLPYPSDFFRKADATTKSGYRLVPTGAAVLLTGEGEVADPTVAHGIDGASRVPSIVAVLPGPVLRDGLVGVLDDAARSVSADSPSVLVDATTGQLVAHFTDVDPNATDERRRAIVIHPLAPLAALHRYVVALHGVRVEGGGLAPAAEGFRRLRDHLSTPDPVLVAEGARFERDVFPVLAQAGVSRGGIQLAWDFTTGSDDEVTTDMLQVRELTLQWLAQSTPTVTVDAVAEDPSPEIWRTVHGTITGPLFCESAEPGAVLARDSNGRIRLAGTATFPYVAQIPASVRDQAEPGRVIEYGHGFFGGLGEVEDLAHIPNRLHGTALGIPWWGMSKDDLGVLLGDMSAHPANALRFTERVHQAMANWMVTSAAIPELSKQDAFRRPNGGPSVLASANPVFMGISQGHILGGVISVLDPRIERAALQVGGAGLTHVMTRARPLGGLLFILRSAVADRLDQMKFIAMMQRGLDRIDPATYAELHRAGGPPGSPPDRRFLLQCGLGDSEVPNLGTFLHARALGMAQLDTGTPQVYGLPQVSGPYAGSAIATYDFGFDLASIYGAMQPASSTNVIHEGLRTHETVLSVIDRFYAEGVVASTCSGPCDPD